MNREQIANHFGKLLVDEQDNTFQVKCTIFKAHFSSVNGTMSSKIYHIQATLEDDEHLIETVYYSYSFETIVLSDV